MVTVTTMNKIESHYDFQVIVTLWLHCEVTLVDFETFAIRHKMRHIQFPVTRIRHIFHVRVTFGSRIFLHFGHIWIRVLLGKYLADEATSA